MTTLPTDPPADDDDWSHEQLADSQDAPVDPDDVDVYPKADPGVIPDAERDAFPPGAVELTDDDLPLADGPSTTRAE